MRFFFLAILAMSTAADAAPAVKRASRAVVRVRSTARENEADEKAIRQSARDFTQAFNRGDPKAVAVLWTPEGEYIDESGQVFTGRATIEKEYAAFFKEHPKSQIQVKIGSIRFVGPTLAYEEGTTRLVEEPVGATSISHYLVLHLKQDGNWLMASVRDLDSVPLSNHESLKVLESIIGDWTVSSGDRRVEMNCEWIENRNFIRRRYQVYHEDDLVGSGFEIIGVDPEIGEIASWQFTDDGGLGHNIWRSDGRRWIIEAKGTTRDGLPTSSTNILTPIDKDSFNWESVDRTVGHEPAGATPMAKVVRKK
jgi:uncharacterized protein (TIGR02246 family)